MSKLPEEIWVDRESLIRPAICSHVSRRNEFEPGVRYYLADKADDQFAWGLLCALAFGVLWALGIMYLAGGM